MKLIILTLLCHIYCLGFSQISIRNNSLINPDRQVAYHGYHNDLMLQGIEVDSTFLLISTTDTNRIFNQIFSYKPQTKYTYDTLRIFKADKCLTTVIFKIEKLNRPACYFGSIRDTCVTKKDLLSNPGLIFSYEPQLAKINFRILHFEASIIKRNGKEISLIDKSTIRKQNWSEKRFERYTLKQMNKERAHHSNNQFSQKQLKKIHRMKKDEILWFKEVRVISADSRANIIYINFKLKICAEN